MDNDNRPLGRISWTSIANAIEEAPEGAKYYEMPIGRTMELFFVMYQVVPELKAALNELAKSEGKAVSDLLRKVLIQALCHSITEE